MAIHCVVREGCVRSTRRSELVLGLVTWARNSGRLHHLDHHQMPACALDGACFKCGDPDVLKPSRHDCSLRY
ncbi:unnamed protein product [Toxocara canis]|uniref:Secreted protein n=1 Tax=Toxocara canis TaxID=6265 RepID=A0A183VDE2_TOXCA|nr:unnamed protein product [Toxocara canis]